MTSLRRFLTCAVLAVSLAACFDSAPESEFPTGDPTVFFHRIDKSVDDAAAQKVLRRVLEAAPQLKTLRASQEAAAGSPVRLNLTIQSGPDPEGMNELEKTHYYVYVNTSGKDGLINTFTFVVKSDVSEVAVFDDTGDNVIPVAQWAAGLKTK